MRTITIRGLHLQTGRWVRHAANRGPLIITDRGRQVAIIRPIEAGARPSLPDREAQIRKRSRIPVDSTLYVSEQRDRG